MLGALSSGMLLYGISLVYGYTGNTGFEEIATALTGADRQLGLVFGLVFVLAGLAFKISAVPFHMWTPDVYEGAPTPVTAFFAAAPKMAAMALLVRVTMGAFEPIAADWQQIIVFISIASMVLGSFAAIGQKNIKRLMAYSSIGHMGFALVGLAANSQDGVRGVAIYMLIYLVMTLGTFAFILAMRRKDGSRRADRRSRRPVDHQSDHGDDPDHPDVLAGRHSAARRLLGQVVRLPRRHQCRALRAGGHRRAGLGGRRLLLSAHHQDHVVRRAGRRLRADDRGTARLVLGVSGAFVLFYVLIGGPIGRWPKPRPRPSSRPMAFPLAPTARADGYRLEAHDTIGSTNARALECAARAIAGKLWVVSRQQESGRGRRGRAWATPPGNLAATLLIVTGRDLRLAATLGFVAGLALSDALDAVVPGHGIAIAPMAAAGRAATASS